MQVAKPTFPPHQLARPKYRGDQISKAQPKYHRLLLFMRVYLHIEATGLGPEDEEVAIGIVDSSGNVLLDSLVRPQRKTTWPRAQRIHGISPAAVATAPTWPELAPAIRAAVPGLTVVAYGADFHNRFVRKLLARGEGTECCGRAWMPAWPAPGPGAHWWTPRPRWGLIGSAPAAGPTARQSPLPGPAGPCGTISITRSKLSGDLYGTWGRASGRGRQGRSHMGHRRMDMGNLLRLT